MKAASSSVHMIPNMECKRNSSNDSCNWTDDTESDSTSSSCCKGEKSSPDLKETTAASTNSCEMVYNTISRKEPCNLPSADSRSSTNEVFESDRSALYSKLSSTSTSNASLKSTNCSSDVSKYSEIVNKRIRCSNESNNFSSASSKGSGNLLCRRQKASDDLMVFSSQSSEDTNAFRKLRNIDSSASSKSAGFSTDASKESEAARKLLSRDQISPNESKQISPDLFVQPVISSISPGDSVRSSSESSELTDDTSSSVSEDAKSEVLKKYELLCSSEEDCESSTALTKDARYDTEKYEGEAIGICNAGKKQISICENVPNSLYASMAEKYSVTSSSAIVSGTSQDLRETLPTVEFHCHVKKSVAGQGCISESNRKCVLSSGTNETFSSFVQNTSSDSSREPSSQSSCNTTSSFSSSSFDSDTVNKNVRASNASRYGMSCSKQNWKGINFNVHDSPLTSAKDTDSSNDEY